MKMAIMLKGKEIFTLLMMSMENICNIPDKLKTPNILEMGNIITITVRLGTRESFQIIYMMGLEHSMTMKVEYSIKGLLRKIKFKVKMEFSMKPKMVIIRYLKAPLMMGI